MPWEKDKLQAIKVETKRYEHKTLKIKLVTAEKRMMKNVRNKCNLYGEVYLQQEERK